MKIKIEPKYGGFRTSNRDLSRHDRTSLRCTGMSIAKISIDVPDSPAKGVTMRFETDESVSEALVRIATKLKLSMSKEQIHSRFSLMVQGGAGHTYFPLQDMVCTHLDQYDFAKVCIYFHSRRHDTTKRHSHTTHRIPTCKSPWCVAPIRL